MEGIFEMKSTTHQVVYGIVYINTHMGELFSQYHIELFKFDNQNIFICLYRLLLQLYLHQIINDFKQPNSPPEREDSAQSRRNNSSSSRNLFF